MTTPIEKQCIMGGLQTIALDLGLPHTKDEEDGLSRSGSSTSGEGENIFETSTMTTVIVPALGMDMAELYSDGQIKLLASNVRQA